MFFLDLKLNVSIQLGSFYPDGIGSLWAEINYFTYWVWSIILHWFTDPHRTQGLYMTSKHATPELYPQLLLILKRDPSVMLTGLEAVMWPRLASSSFFLHWLPKWHRHALPTIQRLSLLIRGTILGVWRRNKDTLIYMTNNRVGKTHLLNYCEWEQRCAQQEAWTNHWDGEN